MRTLILALVWLLPALSWAQGTLGAQGDITAVRAGNGLVGGAEVGPAALSVACAPGSGLICNPDDISIDSSVLPNGNGTANYLPLWTDANTLGNSIVQQVGASIYVAGSAALNNTDGTTPTLTTTMTGGTGVARTLANFNFNGAGAQLPSISLSSNGTPGLSFSHYNAFQGALVDHNYASATELAFGLRGVTKCTISNAGLMNCVGGFTSGGTTVPVGTGTAGRSTRWSGTSTLATGAFTDDGTSASIAGTLTAGNGLIMSAAGNNYLYSSLGFTTGQQHLNISAAGTGGIVTINSNAGGITNTGTGGLWIYPGANGSTPTHTLSGAGDAVHAGDLTVSGGSINLNSAAATQAELAITQSGQGTWYLYMPTSDPDLKFYSSALASVVAWWDTATGTLTQNYNMTVTRADGGSHANRPVLSINNTDLTGAFGHRADLSFNVADSGGVSRNHVIQAEGQSLYISPYASGVLTGNWIMGSTTANAHAVNGVVNVHGPASGNIPGYRSTNEGIANSIWGFGQYQDGSHRWYYYNGSVWDAKCTLSTAGVMGCIGGFTGVGGAAVPDGSGTTNYLAKWTPDGNSLGNSSWFDDGSATSTALSTFVATGAGAGVTGIFQAGADTTLTTAARNGYRVNVWSDGNLYLDHKTFDSGSTFYRFGRGAQAGSAFTWMQLSHADGHTTMPFALTVQSNFTAGSLYTHNAAVIGDLNVTGNAGVTDPDTHRNVNIIDATALAAGVGGGILLSGVYTGGGAVAGGGGIKLAKTNATDGNFSFDLALYARANGGSVAEGFRLLSYGAARVHYPSAGGQTVANITDAGARYGNLMLGNGGTAVGTGGALVFGNGQSEAAGSLGMAAIKGMLTNGAGNTTGTMSFSVRMLTTDNFLTEKMSVHSNGVNVTGNLVASGCTYFDNAGQRCNNSFDDTNGELFLQYYNPSGGVAVGDNVTRTHLNVWGHVSAKSGGEAGNTKGGFHIDAAPTLYRSTADGHLYLTNPYNTNPTGAYHIYIKPASVGGYSILLGGNSGLGVQVNPDGFALVGAGAAPIVPLDLYNTTYAGQVTSALTNAGSRYGLLGLYDAGNATGSGGGIVFGFAASHSNNSLGVAAIKAWAQDGTSNTIGDLTFSTRASVGATAMTERMRLRFDGNIGIGNQVPQSRVDITSLQADTVSSHSNGIEFSNNTSGTGPWAQAAIWPVGQTSFNGDLVFGTDGDGVNNHNPTEKVRIIANGSVGIGTPLPGAKLQIYTTPADPGTYSLSNWAGAGYQIPFFSKNPNANTVAGVPASAQPAMVLGREGVGGVAYANFAEFKISRAYAPENSLAEARTRLDFALTGGQSDQYGTNILSLFAGGVSDSLGNQSRVNLVSANAQMQSVAGLYSGIALDISSTFAAGKIRKNALPYTTTFYEGGAPNCGNTAAWNRCEYGTTYTYSSPSVTSPRGITEAVGRILANNDSGLADFRIHSKVAEHGESDVRGQTWTFSVWLKGTAGVVPTLAMNRENFTYDTKALACALATTGVWQRCSITATFSNTAAADNSYITVSIFNFTATGGAVDLYGAQLERNSQPTPLQTNDDSRATSNVVADQAAWANQLRVANTMQRPYMSVTPAGNILLQHPTSNLIQYDNVGVAAPTFTTRSAGTKIVLYQEVGASSVDYAIGINGSTLWSSVPTTAAFFNWYGGTTSMMTLTGANLDVNTDLAKFGSTRDGLAYINGNELNAEYAVNGIATLYFNYRGYNGGTTQFRDIIMADGKNATACTLTGSTKILNCIGGLQVNGANVGVSSAVSGTTGTIAKFTSGSAIGDSLITESGSTITVTGALMVSGDISDTTGPVVVLDDIGLAGEIYGAYTINATAPLWINKNGYNGGTTQFRDLIIYDGKGVSILSIVGSTKAASLAGDLQVGDADTDKLDSRGRFGVSGTNPSINSCGTGAVTGEAQSMQVRFNGTTCVINFNRTFTAAPYCVISPANGFAAGDTARAYVTATTTTVTITYDGAGADDDPLWNIFCPDRY